MKILSPSARLDVGEPVSLGTRIPGNETRMPHPFVCSRDPRRTRGQVRRQGHVNAQCVTPQSLVFGSGGLTPVLVFVLQFPTDCGWELHEPLPVAPEFMTVHCAFLNEAWTEQKAVVNPLPCCPHVEQSLPFWPSVLQLFHDPSAPPPSLPTEQLLVCCWLLPS